MNQSEATTLSLIQTEEQFYALKEEWNPLLKQTPANSFFLTWEYLSLWWKHYGHEFDLSLITARTAAGTLVGVAPLMIGTGHTFPRNRFRHLTFLAGLGDSLAEYQDFIILPAWEHSLAGEFADFVQRELRDDWDVLLLRDTQEDSPHTLKFVSALGKAGNHSLQLSSRPAPYLPLTSSWDEFVAAKSKNFRKTFKNQWNRLHKKHGVEWVTGGVDLPLEESMETLIQLNHLRWGEQGEAFQSPQFLAFHQELAQTIAPFGWLYLRLLRVDGTFAAARYDFLYDGKLWNNQNGWDPALEHLSLGKMIIGYSIRECIALGAREYDFLGGASEYKRFWASNERNLLRVEVANPAKRAGFFLQQVHLLKGVISPQKAA